MKKKRVLREWVVEYTATYRGETVVEAYTADEAEEKVSSGDFEPDEGASMWDCRVRSSARENL